MTDERIWQLARAAAIDFHFHFNTCVTDAEYEACWAVVESSAPIPDSICEESCMDEFRQDDLYEATRNMASWIERLMKKARDE